MVKMDDIIIAAFCFQKELEEENKCYSREIYMHHPCLFSVCLQGIYRRLKFLNLAITITTLNHRHLHQQYSGLIRLLWVSSTLSSYPTPALAACSQPGRSFHPPHMDLCFPPPAIPGTPWPACFLRAGGHLFRPSEPPVALPPYVPGCCTWNTKM